MQWYGLVNISVADEAQPSHQRCEKSSTNNADDCYLKLEEKIMIMALKLKIVTEGRLSYNIFHFQTHIITRNVAKCCTAIHQIDNYPPYAPQ